VPYERIKVTVGFLLLSGIVVVVVVVATVVVGAAVDVVVVGGVRLTHLRFLATLAQTSLLPETFSRLAFSTLFVCGLHRYACEDEQRSKNCDKT
jgi:hypothetical protein